MAKKKGVSLAVGRGEKLPVSKGAGLTAKGRAKYNRETGSDLKAPQPEGGARKKSFCARMSGMPGPMKDEKGRPTRKAASLKRWKCQMSDLMEQARELATHASEIRHLQSDMDKMVEDMEEIKKAIIEINKTLSEAKGGWKMLLAVGGAAGVVGSAITWVVGHWK